jgi:hypothetical protein
MDRITSYLAIAFLMIGVIYYPFLIKNGYLTLDEPYPLIGSFIAIFGGITANIIYLIKNKKNKK